MSKAQRLRDLMPLAPPDDSHHRAALDRRILEMRRMLAAMRPPSTADALRTLRDAFPDIPLDKRVQALMEINRQ